MYSIKDIIIDYLAEPADLSTVQLAEAESFLARTYGRIPVQAALSPDHVNEDSLSLVTTRLHFGGDVEFSE